MNYEADAAFLATAMHCVMMLILNAHAALAILMPLLFPVLVVQ